MSERSKEDTLKHTFFLEAQRKLQQFYSSQRTLHKKGKVLHFAIASEIAINVLTSTLGQFFGNREKCVNIFQIF